MKDIVTKYKWSPRANWDPVLRSNWNRDHRRATICLCTSRMWVEVVYSHSLGYWMIACSLHPMEIFNSIGHVLDDKKADYNTVIQAADTALDKEYHLAKERIANSNGHATMDNLFVLALKDALA